VRDEGSVEGKIGKLNLEKKKKRKFGKVPNKTEKNIQGKAR
jgi:hypothetical protein